MTVDVRSRGIAIKSANDETGAFEALVSVFGNEDSYGDIMVPGAFTRTLKEWRENGGELPFLWSHASHDPMAYVAGISDAEETDEGLVVRGKFDLDTEQSRKAYNLLKSGRVKEFSFGFIVQSSEWGEKDGREVRFVKDVDLLEASMTLLGANPDTRLLAIKETRTSVDLSEHAVKAVADEVMRRLHGEKEVAAKRKNEEADTTAASPEEQRDEAGHAGKSDAETLAAAVTGLFGFNPNHVEGNIS